MKKNVKKKSGFTLIELIIVISIIAVLAAIAVPKYGEIQRDAKVKVDMANAKVIADATTILIGNEDITLPSTGDIVVELGGVNTDAAEVIDTKIATYLQNVPIPKASETGFFTVTITSAGAVSVTP